MTAPSSWCSPGRPPSSRRCGSTPSPTGRSRTSSRPLPRTGRARSGCGRCSRRRSSTTSRPSDADDLATVGTYTREGELEIVVPERLGPRVEALLRDAFGDALFATDERHVDALVAELLLDAGATLAVAESCTGGGLGRPSHRDPGGIGVVPRRGHHLRRRGEGRASSAWIPRSSPRTGRSRPSAPPRWRPAPAPRWRRPGRSASPASPDRTAAARKNPSGWCSSALRDRTASVTAEHRFRGNREVIRHRSQTAALHHLRTALLQWSRASIGTETVTGSTQPA